MNQPVSPHHPPAHPDILFGPAQSELLREEILADLLQASAARQPDHPALISAERSLSYAELDARAALVAARLIRDGVQAGQIVGLWLPRGIELLVLQAGIAKAGAAWLPVDEDTPVERLQVCLDDASGAGVLTCAAFAPRLAQLGRPVWTAEDLLGSAASADAAAAAALVRARRAETSPDMPAYVIYTSGSTGKPKGILINQRSICHFLRSENAVLGVHSGDKVYQGFSVAFDMSFEEIWIAYLVGATLWLGPKEISGDPETLPRMLAEQQVTVLHAVPTLLALFNQDVPSLRLINLGGEMCPEALVERWSRPGRQMFNTYGPTEATVSASLARLQPGQPVTIGTPLPNYGLLVIDAEAAASEPPQLKLLARGATGELCITGPGLAAGYLGRPDLTAEKFLANPWGCGLHDGRLYRTGDLARIGADGEVLCLGRADDQVKIRGFRVELGEIEAVLAQQAGVGTVAVLLRKDDGIDQLVAYLVTEAGATVAPRSLRAALASALPPYMVPGRYQFLDAMPRLTSGKIDRKALKAMPLQADSAGAAGEASAEPDSDLAATPAEQALFAALATLFPGQPILRQADFFSDLGGHSFFAARLASALRTDARFAHITVRDIYQQRQIGKIAQVLAAAPAGAAAQEEAPWTPPSALKRWTCGLAQAAAMPALVALRMAQWLAPFFTYHFFTGDPGDSVARAIAASVAVFLLATLAEFAIAIAGKWLIAGRLQAGSYPLWGWTYYRWWLADRLVEAAPAYLLSGSSLSSWWLRALGARVGKEVIIGSMTLRAPDLLEIGDNVSVGNAVNFENARVQRGRLLLGPITLEQDACVSSFAVLEGNTRVAALGHLEGQSALADGQTVGAGRIWSGSPARDIGAFDATVLPPRPVASALRRAGEALFFLFGILLIVTLFFMPVFPSFVLIDWFDDAGWLPWIQGEDLRIQLLRYFLLAFPASAVLIILTALLSAGIRWSVLPRLRPGQFAIHSRTYCAKWLVSQIQESSLNVLHGIYATVFAPNWYRLLGAKVGKDAEISTALGVVPDMLTLGDETFIADAVMLGDEEIDGGWMTMKPTVISHRSFVGNGAYIPDGTVLPEHVLIGVHSRAPDNERMQSGDTWLGSPPLNLPAREQTSGYPERLTFHPSPLRRLGRGLIEAFRIVAPHALVIAVGYTLVLAVMPAAGAGRWAEVTWDLTLAGLIYGIGNYVFVVLLKWLLIGRYRKQSEPMWTPFVWLSEGVTNLYEGIAVPNFMRYLRGTPWLPLAFNLMGCRIGKGVYLDTTDITEFDCVHIGDYSELNALTCPQTHLFEDRVMKIDHVQIGSKVYMGPRSAVLYSAVVGDHARLGPLTLVMKGEQIPPRSYWAGCPAAPAR
ncbi:Pls/PosA family non-ribosomal peptide synthetase [Duganella qianjiadongensis]|uniref:Amino acid adenylation domain-containing protein n=1 Tax=Duganella qianjiadongensis TaxID=2692176 RepID=A0ABW9VJ82_9BURK|nr:Pls/PosA family non-ribosomal peptide synthetase [Duganella qianjiadongensis]MYM39357.1 amino acid adenylation domain-containing protein [Duganella qianjiadongensis]